ncbi:unnamed protein product [Ostreobium quekettii]|uniref:Uncharacterized protein n=1 Tax=Ostreobium quekettii TaxID=121088 RepID=A0A8S1IVN7_9CHLO|nr:unnamed protein product [Ostreobium quekettii]|eukprot:evm.model.scf_2085.2 EVM.evm.TU.scf_2085.2   scf_2085:15117-15581(-)
MGDRRPSFGSKSMKKYGGGGAPRVSDAAKTEKIKAGVIMWEGMPPQKLTKGDRLELATQEGKGLVRVRNWKGGDAGDILFTMMLGDIRKCEEPYSFKEKGVNLSSGSVFGKAGRYLVLEGMNDQRAQVRIAFTIVDPQAWISAFGLFPEFKASR